MKLEVNGEKEKDVKRTSTQITTYGGTEMSQSSPQPHTTDIS